MSMRIWVEQLNGETLALEVTAEMTMREVKRRIKAMHMWEDGVSFDTTVVEIFVGDKKATNGETVAELGLSEGSSVSAVLKKNLAVCSDKSGLGSDLDLEALVIVEIPDSVTEIGARAFQQCRRLAKVIIPSSVTRIGPLAFCFSGLREVTIPDSVTEIGVAMFDSCMSLVSVTIPNSVTQILHLAFRHCRSLKGLTIPDSVTRIVHGAFSGCMQLTLRAPARLAQKSVKS